MQFPPALSLALGALGGTMGWWEWGSRMERGMKGV